MVLFILADCGARGDTTAALNTPTIDTLAGGVIHVKNTGPTAWADTNGWKLVLEHSFTMPEGSPGQLNNPGEIVADSKGNIYVLDEKPATIKAYDADGTFRRTIGREGSGPGEFRQWGMLTIARDTLVQHDPGQSRTSTFTTDGLFLHVWRTMCCYSRALRADDNGLVPIPGSIRIDTTGKRPGLFDGAGFVRFRLDSSVVDSIFFPPEPERKLWRFQNKNSRSIWSIPFTAGTSSNLDRTGRFIWGNQEEYRFIVSKTGLDTIRIFESPRGTTAVIPDSLRQEKLDMYLKGNPNLRGIAKLADIPTSYPLWTTFTVDGANNIWVLLPGPHGPGSAWDVFTSEGRLLGRVPAPFADTYRTFWTRDRVYSIADDDTTGALSIRVYRIDRPKGL